MSSLLKYLQKAWIIPLGQDGSWGIPIPVQFNPNKYSINKSNQFASVAIPGRDSPIIQFIRGEAETLSLELFFDTYTYENSIDVRIKYTNRITQLLEIDEELHAPPVCVFEWGGHTFTGVLERADTSFTMFDTFGTPVRATVTVSFKQISETQKPKSSPDRSKIRSIKEGDSLWMIAAREYGDPLKWKEIAKANDIDDPRKLSPGTQIIIPPLR